MAAGECQHLADEAVSARCSRESRLDLGLAIANLTGVQSLNVARYDREQIVEVVCDASGKLTDHLHPLGLDQLLFGLFAFPNLGSLIAESLQGQPTHECDGQRADGDEHSV